MLILMQGASGSGKSTIAKLLQFGIERRGVVQCYVVSADDYFKQVDGSYVFDQSFLSKAHEYALNYVKCRLSADCNLDICVIVDNTNTRRWEAQKYLDLAIEYGHDVQVVRVDSRCFKNIHGVPDEVIEKQRQRMENLLD